METKLFTTEQVKRFFNILESKERAQCERYKGIDKANPNRVPCEKEIFVDRTINKWFNSKYLILFRENERLGTEYKNYIFISSISYRLGWGEEIEISYFDYNSPQNFYQEMKISHNKALRLEGIWCEDGSLHTALYEIMQLDIPEREFSFTAYDWSKYKTRGRGTEAQKLEKIKTSVTVFAKTHKEAAKKVKKIEKETKLQIYF